MPRSTISERYEFAVLGAAGSHAEDTLGDNAKGFLLLFSADHEVEKRFVYGDDWPGFEEREQLIEGAHAHFLYDPFDFPEYGWVQWANLPLEVFERAVSPIVLPGRNDYEDSGAFMV